MPLYNTEKYLPQAIESIIKQRFQNWQLIIVDDGSTDNSGDIAKAYVQKDPRISVYHKANGGTGSALNYGIYACSALTSKYITWVSSDNIYRESFLDVLRHALNSNQDYQFAYGDFEYINHLGEPINQQIIHKKLPKTHLINGYDLGMVFLYTSELQQKVGRYWEKICEDYNFAVRAAVYTDFLLVNELLGSFRIRPGQLTNSNVEYEKIIIASCRELAQKIFT